MIVVASMGISRYKGKVLKVKAFVANTKNKTVRKIFKGKKMEDTWCVPGYFYLYVVAL